jgi:DNA repair protein SbcC/Rad50
MNIRLIKLSLKQFKGTTEREIDFQGKNVNIYGENGTGKTTIPDAFCWLLFGKNSEWVTDFEIKPIGVERPEVEVEGVLDVDGTELTLKKVLTEKWVTRRGFAEENFTGHETKCYINKIEKKATDYKAYIDSLVTEDTFKTLTSAKAFLDKKKPEMRKILLDMAGTVRDEDIAEGDADLMEIVQAMQDKGYSLDDLGKLVKQNLNAYNGEQANISPRIDEHRRTMPEVQDWSKLEAGLEKGRDYLRRLDEQLASASAGNQVYKKKQSELYALQNRIEDYKRDQIQKANAEYYELIRQRDSVQSIIRTYTFNHDTFADSILTYQQEIDKKKDAIHALRDEYMAVAAKKKQIATELFVPMTEGECDRCGQSLPEDQLLKINLQAEERFTAQKNADIDKLEKRLSDITTEGMTLKNKYAEYQGKLESAQAELAKALDELKIAKATLADLEKKLQGRTAASEIDLSGNKQYQDLLAELEAKRQEIEEPEDKTQDIIAAKAKIEGQMADIRKLLEGKGEREKSEKRIAELEERGKELAGLIAVEKKRQSMIEKFIRVKAERLEGSINALFEGITFRLFDMQINGGVVDDCTPLIHGVEYSDASNSERIRANQSIVRAFQRANHTFIVYFLDNAEAATHYIDMDCQVIKLFVSKDKQLKIEREEI